MKYFGLFCLLTITLIRPGYSQAASDTIPVYPYEFGMQVGHNVPVGMMTAYAEYHFRLVRGFIAPQLRFGGAYPEGAFISSGISVYPIGQRRITPYLGSCYTWTAGQYFPSETGPEYVELGSNNYFSPYAGLKWYDKKSRSVCINLIVGYSFLQDSPDLTVFSPSPAYVSDMYQRYLWRISDHYFWGLGVGFKLEKLKGQWH